MEQKSGREDEIIQNRQKALTAFQENSTELNLWKAIIAFEGVEFITSGRGKDKVGSTRFKYEVSKKCGSGGRHYDGESVDGYGNELWIVIDGVKKEKSISRSTVNRAFQNALAVEGKIKGPKQLNVPGAHSYLYPIFVQYGIIDPA